MMERHPFQSIVLIGTGRLAEQWCALFTENNIPLKQLVGRSKDRLDELSGGKLDCALGFSEMIRDADLYILAVSDDAIQTVSDLLPAVSALVVHCSGSVHLDALKKHHRRGVFYPLQTFSAGRKINWGEVPICVCASEANDKALLHSLTVLFNGRYFDVDNSQRKQLHLAAVFVNNFVNHHLAVAERLCVDQELDFSVLFPLMRETLAKAMDGNAFAAQTGPARRGDDKVIARQAADLENYPVWKALYSATTDSINRSYTELDENGEG
ncbi:DUF2520 domain-containing protein [Chitinophagales bacterium]|nr:DUF2520 domain-containing protein [Chitinophagales bacterium]